MYVNVHVYEVSEVLNEGSEKWSKRYQQTTKLYHTDCGAILLNWFYQTYWSNLFVCVCKA